MSIDHINELMLNADLLKKESPQPLRKQRRKATEFPIDALPSVLKEAVLAVHDKIQAPLPICAQSVLAVANLVVQGHANIMLPFGQERPISCFFLTIAESGERKSSCDNEILNVIKDYEAKLSECFHRDMEHYKNDFDTWEKQRATILNSKTKNLIRENITKALDAIGKEPTRPLTPLLVCSEPTFEGLCKLMVSGQPSLGIFSSEGGQFIGGHGLKNENKVHTAAALSNMWDGEPIKRIRSSDNITILDGRRLSIHLMVQPSIAAGFLSDNTLRDQGLLSRILVASPASAAGSRFCRSIKLETHQALNELARKLSSILNTPLPTKEGFMNQLTPRVIQLSEESGELYRTFSDEVELKLAPEGDFSTIKGFANKLLEHAIRLASTIALIDDIHTELLDVKYLEMGISLVRYYADEALRLFDDGMTDPNIVLAERLLHWLHNTWDEENVSLPDIYQRSLNAIGIKAKALEIARILEDHGWLEKNEEPTIVKGQHRRNTWKIIKA